MKTILLTLTVLISLNSVAQINKPKIDSIERLNEIQLRSTSIFGSSYEAQNRTGSSYFIGPKELEKYQYVDINRILLSVPGVNVIEEDGFGLRPNISLRGTSPDRSSKITLMEDGILISPAPYSAPAAYYFPNIARMQSVEVLKGSSQIQYGPNTTGGALNLISTYIPDSITAVARVNIGNYNSKQVQFRLGNSSEHFGYVAEYLNYNSNGFKSLDYGGNTGFDRNDYTGKFRINKSRDAKVFQSLTIKLQFSEEVSHETYLGLTQDDYNINPYRRYLASAKDNITSQHDQITLTHYIKPLSNLEITTVGYSNNFKRNWYKLDNVDTGEGSISIASILTDPNKFAQEYAAIASGSDTNGDVFNVKANNRKYYGRGIQSKLNVLFGKQNFSNLELGVRYHRDEEDRFQWVDGYGIDNHRMIQTSAGLKGTDANRIAQAEALSLHTLYKLVMGRLTITPGLRYESITLNRKDYGISDPERTESDLSLRENNINIWIPGMGANFKFNSHLSLYGGIHKGFSPPGSTPGSRSEESINYELGSRFFAHGLRGEIVGFFNDYSNLLGSDLAASGGAGTLDTFNAGEVNVGGIELSLSYDPFIGRKSLSLPISINYTFTDSSFKDSFDSDLYGEVDKGDEIPYITRNQFNVMVGIDFGEFIFNLSSRFVGTTRTMAGRGSIAFDEKIPRNLIIDVSGKYRINSNLSITTNIINFLDSEYMVSRQPAGLRPGHPFGINTGLAWEF